MKKALIAGMALGLAMTATSAFALGNPAAKAGGSGIVDSFHDLSNNSVYGDSQSRICVFCHHPHQAQVVGTAEMGAADYSPLWNHDVTTKSFTTYNNGTQPTSGRNMLNAVQNGPGGVSLLCLSCHDGTVALNAYSSFSTGRATTTGEKGAGDQTLGATSRALIGGGTDNMSNHHPIGFDYTAVVALDDEIAPITRTIATGTTIGDLLYNGKQFECVTCHDVHNSSNEANAEKFLWQSNNGSAFCLVCHLKAGLKQTDF